MAYADTLNNNDDRKFHIIMTEHGDYDSELKKWFCSYWMSEDEWMDIHSYSPSNASEEKQGDDRKEEEVQ